MRNKFLQETAAFSICRNFEFLSLYLIQRAADHLLNISVLTIQCTRDFLKIVPQIIFNVQCKSVRHNLKQWLVSVALPTVSTDTVQYCTPSSQTAACTTYVDIALQGVTPFLI